MVVERLFDTILVTGAAEVTRSGATMLESCGADRLWGHTHTCHTDLVSRTAVFTALSEVRLANTVV